ncbi:phospholipase D family protein [uncultured Moraxella sp.]|uniref:phospholipase D family protein n=1 Tax=uncultured Moraxella sp. TaxID=263769 RepID=UPI002600C59B|nr:phospholipase D family protein [uncultured Moraxella sp.]
MHSKPHIITLIGSGLLALLLSACQSLPSTPHLPNSEALTLQSQLRLQDTRHYSATKLGDSIAAQTENHPNLSGYYPIATGANAFAARSILSDLASQTIDIQYYIWHNDEAGQLMLKDLWEAAERGVKVRLLLDDMNSSESLDQILLRFAEHPNVAVRLMNPMANRKIRTVNYLSNPMRINARMHNKSMTFDNRISIIGGRNIGNEYLNNNTVNNFADLDVMLLGSVVKDVTNSFEEYWASPLAYDIETLVKKSYQPTTELLSPAVWDDLNHSQSASSSERAVRRYRQAVQSSTIADDLIQKRLPFRWTKVRLFVDPVEKLTRAKATADQHLVAQLQRVIGRPKANFSVISSYFVPTKDGTDTLIKLANDGVKISILTNSFDATDVGVVHSGYAHWRKPLLMAGVNLFEVKSTATNDADNDNKFWRTKQLTTTSLHAKAFAVDDRFVFIGSYNIDPRSANINTELGVLIYDQALATQLHQALQNSPSLIQQAYKLELDDRGLIRWHTINDGTPTIYRNEPNTNLKDRAGIVMLGLLPIDGLL